MVRDKTFSIFKKRQKDLNLHRKEEIMRKAGFSCKTVFCIAIVS